MGFDIYASEGTLVFEGTRYTGAEVKVRLDLPLVDLEAFDALAEGVTNPFDTDFLERRLAWLVEHVLKSWNLEAKGEPIPLTIEGINALPRTFTRRLVTAWLRTVTDIDLPLVPSSAPSTNGVSSTAQ